jgi:hypothetical protein
MTDLEQAIEIIGNRRTDSRLIKAVGKFLDSDLPSIISKDAVPVSYAPHVAGGTNAEIHFAKEVRANDGIPVLTSYIEDRFTVSNPAKVNHWRPKIAWPKGQITRQWIVAPQFRQGQPIGVGTTPTIYEQDGEGVSVQDYQLAIGAIAFGGNQAGDMPEIVDYSSWYTRQSDLRNSKRSAVGYYPAVMALYSVYGVLFRYANQPGEASVTEFRRTIVDPAAEISAEALGVKPVLVTRECPNDGSVTNMSGISTIDMAFLQSYAKIEAGL